MLEKCWMYSIGRPQLSWADDTHLGWHVMWHSEI